MGNAYNEDAGKSNFFKFYPKNNKTLWVVD